MNTIGIIYKDYLSSSSKRLKRKRNKQNSWW